MATYAGDVFAFTWNSKAMAAYITKFGGADFSTPVEDITPFGVTYRQFAPIVLIGSKTLQFDGVYDDTATNGPDAVFGTASLGTSATGTITWGGSKTTAATMINVGYKRSPVVGKKTEYSVMLQPTGTITEM